jgi:bifunctional UDP-N-acetylglucosamine pyrophosphorylase/glucosamine-1-phosphate N-acetyltransferase
MVDSGRRKLGVIVGDDVKIGINASLMPGVKIGSRSWIGPGVVLEKDVPTGTIVVLKQQLVRKRRHQAKKKT